MANPLGIVARFTHQTFGTASDYYNKFDLMMKRGSLENVLYNLSR
jgi:hypothetical protein